jgi:hypothetical protein
MRSKISRSLSEGLRVAVCDPRGSSRVSRLIRATIA